MTAAFVLHVAAIAAVLSVALAATAVVIPLSRRERMLSILAQFGAGRADDRVRQRTIIDMAKPPVVRAIQLAGYVITPPFVQRRLTDQLNYAGNPTAWPLARVVRARMVGVVVGALLGWWLGGSMSPGRALIGLPVGALFGLFLPEILIRNAATKRQLALEKSLPDVLDAMVIGVEAGLGLDAALNQVAAMLRGPMPDEINRMLQEMKLGLPRSVALRNLSARTNVRDLKRLATALTQAGELGISVAGILREHAAEQRVRRRQRAEEQAQKVAVKLLFPVLFCLFPVIFIVVLGPTVINLMSSFG